MTKDKPVPMKSDAEYIRLLDSTVGSPSEKERQNLERETTEAEFYALSEAGKLTLYVQSILDELGISQNEATSVYEDNQGCLHMTQSQKPTKRTRHVDMRYFAVLDWVEQDLLAVKKISTHDNSADFLTKSLGRTLFYRHVDTLLGKR